MIAIRGANSVTENTTEEMTKAVVELYDALSDKNRIKLNDICCIIISCTRDLSVANPATLLRTNRSCLNTVPLFCVAEFEHESCLPMCVRFLILSNQNIINDEIKHIYLGSAKKLREDISND